MQLLKKFKISYTISLIYLIAGLLWIYLTDDLLHSVVSDDTEMLTQLQNYKGWGFVIMSTLLIFVVSEALISSLKKSNLRNKAFFESNPIPTWICDAHTQKILSVNVAAVDQYGYSEDEFLNMEIDLLKVDYEIKDGIEKHRLKDSTQIYVEVTTKEIAYNHRTCNIVIAQNRTEKIKANQKIHELNTELEKKVEERTLQLQHANNELEAFNYTVSHDLRSPIRSAISLLDLIERKKTETKGEDFYQSLKDIKYFLDKANQQIHDLLAFSLMGKKEKRLEKINLKNSFETVANELTTTIYTDKRYKITIDDLPDVYADQYMIKHVISNLLSNALKFSSKEASPEIIIGGHQDLENEETVFFIQDNGVGFDEQYSENIFKVFKRLHNETEFMGNGAGLAIAERIIMRHGGKIWAKAKLNEGATFYFCLPGVA